MLKLLLRDIAYLKVQIGLMGTVCLQGQACEHAFNPPNIHHTASETQEYVVRRPTNHTTTRTKNPTKFTLSLLYTYLVRF